MTAKSQLVLLLRLLFLSRQFLKKNCLNIFRVAKDSRGKKWDTPLKNCFHKIVWKQIESNLYEHRIALPAASRRLQNLEWQPGGPQNGLERSF